MSAYVVDSDHIRYLVEAAGRLGRGSFSFWSEASGTRVDVGSGRDLSASAFGQMLWDENIESVVARYPDCRGENGRVVHDRLPGPSDEGFEYEHPRRQGWVVIDPVAVLKACACYEYQSCEHDGWRTSYAHSAVEMIKAAAVRSLSGYEAAAWGSPAVR